MTDIDNDAQGESPEQRVRDGLLSALIAYLVWGFLPLYFIVVKTVPSLEILAHRVIWAIPFGGAIIYARKQWPEILAACRDRRSLLNLVVSAVLVAGNWLVYIWAVQLEQIFQASLGYYINPLLFALAGVFLLGEHLRRRQAAAILIAGIGVLILATSGGQIPFIALFLGTTFALYGIIRKRVAVGAMPGLFIETIILLPIALIYLGSLMAEGSAVFGSGDTSTSIILLAAGPLTVIPLLFFALAAKRLPLATVGMMQFLAPTIQFLVGLYYGEKLTTAHIVCFVCIWSAVLLFSFDALQSSRRNVARSAAR